MRYFGVVIAIAGALLLSCESDRDVAEHFPDGEGASSSLATEPHANVAFNILPVKNGVPLSPANFCTGMKNVKSQTKQDFNEEVGHLCTDGVPTALLNNLVANPFDGIGTQAFTTIRNGGIGSGLVQLSVAFSMKINKKSAPLLLAEEPYIIASPYDQADPYDGRFRMSYKFVAPPPNTNDCDTGFRVEQFSSRRGEKVNFDDTSLHDLRLYRMFPNNFEFMVAARTLVAPTEQFKKSVALRGVMTDPQDPNKAISITVINLVMNGRGRESELLDIVNRYVSGDMRSVYAYHKK